MAKRMLWLSVGMLLTLTALVGRLYQLHIADGPALARAAYGQRTDVLRLDNRGLILDRHGLPLTDPVPRWYLAYFPALAPNGQAVLRQVEQVLGLGAGALVPGRLSEPQVLRSLTAADASRVAQMHLPGVTVAPRTDRYGPDALARHVVGFLSTGVGKMGLEMAYEADLRGERAPTLVATFDGLGRPLGGPGVKLVLPDHGKAPYNLYTTLDAQLQSAVERTLDDVAAPSGQLRAGAVLLDPHNGDLLAVASRPQWEQSLAPDNWSLKTMNRAVTAYPPGSIFKAMVAAAALEAGLVTMDEEFHCDGHYTVGQESFTDNEARSHGDITFEQAIARSCNVVFATIGLERLGADGLRQAMESFGLGQATGLQLPEESAGRLPSLEYGGDIAQAAFGQADLEVTPVQMARAYAAIANGGVLPPVRLVTAVKNQEGVVIRRERESASERIFSRQTARQLQQGLLAVTDPEGEGTGRKAWVAEGGSAGKTGSADGVLMEGPTTTHGWFAGYFPADAPRYVLVVFVEGGQSGGGVAAPIFAAAAEAVLEAERQAP